MFTMTPAFNRHYTGFVFSWEIVGRNKSLMHLSEKVCWNKISQISRHRANGKLVKVSTYSGHNTVATCSHSFLKRSCDGIVPVKGSELKIGDYIPITYVIPIIENPLYYFNDCNAIKRSLNESFGYVCGSFLSNRTEYNDNYLNKFL